MKKIIGGACVPAMLVFVLLAAPLFADTQSTLPKRTVVAPRYNLAKEVTLEGNIQNVVRKPTAGMMFGAHLMVSTAQGIVDAPIGSFLLTGPHAVSFAPGEPVRLVGVMASINHRDVFLTRTIQTEHGTITVRNGHGFFVMPGVQPQITRYSPTGGPR